MDWLFDIKNKSIASNAQRIVADMHHHLDQQQKRNHELELVITQLQHLCTDSLEHEIFKLESRKKELQLELETIDVSILERKEKLLQVKTRVKQLLHENIDNLTRVEGSPPLHDYDNTKLVQAIRTTPTGTDHPIPGKDVIISDTQVLHEDSDIQTEEGLPIRGLLDDDFIEDTEMVTRIKEGEPDFLFLLHRNSTEDLIIYKYNQKGTKDIVTCYKISIQAENEIKEPISSFEKLMAYGAKEVSPQDRDDAEVIQLPPPYSPKDFPTSQYGKLQSSIELPIAPNVVIDIWQSPQGTGQGKGKCWGTTSVDGVKFAVLERIFILSEIRWGLPTIVQVDLFARHPIRGDLLLESLPYSV